MERVPNKAPFLLLFSGKAEADAGRPNHTFVSAQNHPSVHTHRPHNSIILMLRKMHNNFNSATPTF